jgi:thymidine kinase
MKIDRQHTLKQAEDIYLDMKYFFDNKELVYLTTILTAQDILSIIETLEKIFSQNQQFEKCKKLREWNFIVRSYIYNGE